MSLFCRSTTSLMAIPAEWQLLHLTARLWEPYLARTTRKSSEKVGHQTGRNPFFLNPFQPWLGMQTYPSLSSGAKIYAREVRELKLHFFPEVLSNMAQVERVLTAPGGSLLLAGRSGVGRRTALSIISHMHRMTVISPKVSRNYTMKQLKVGKFIGSR